MKTICMTTSLLLTIGVAQTSWAQSTTGGKSGGSTASTGTGYLTEGQRPATTNPNSMTIDDEGASRAYMYVPPTTHKNRAASPIGSANEQTPSKQAVADSSGVKDKSARRKNQPFN
ncbi:hypothetical protein WBJ53_15845 [Spirosoma sp. SC4-14]|uniref:hypothetical protein n=1 Tax=Spirosoma sp. SC4-14 TaxID=3128900 RepID=UPI0030CD9105